MAMPVGRQAEVQEQSPPARWLVTIVVLAVVAVLSGCGPTFAAHRTLDLRRAIPVECEGDAAHCEVLTSFAGVNVYRNHGPTGFCSDEGCRHPTNAYGIRWQCVELFNRFFGLRHGIEPVAGDAKDLFDNAAGVAGLAVHRNGGPTSPAAGDALVLGSGPGHRHGHVAIITAVSATEVGVVEQNVAGRDGTGTYPYDAATNTVLSGDGGRPALGWIRATTAASRAIG